MSENRKGENNPFFGKTQSKETKEKFREIALNREKFHRPGIKVEVIDLQTSAARETIIYNSIRDAVKALDTHLSTLFRREKKGITKLFRGRYHIKIIR
jgi:NUMOD3 motif